MNTLKPKVAIIGAGNVGSTFAFSLMISGLAREIVVVDRDEKKAAGECMDLNHGMSFAPPVRIYHSGYEGCKEADVVVITAGARQKEGQSRVDLVHANVEIFKQIIPSVLKHAGQPVILVVTNPVDILTYVSLKLSGLPRHRVFGSGTLLDTSRFRYLISEHCKIDPRNVHAYIIGEHGDTELPVWSNARIAGMRIDEYCPTCGRQCDRQQDMDAIFEKVKNAAYEIIAAKGATYYAVGLALVRIVGAVLRDENSVLPVSTMIDDFAGIDDVCLSLPCVVNGQGVQQFLRLELTGKEKRLFQASAAAMKDIIRQLRL